jgi:hypothetical protein
MKLAGILALIVLALSWSPSCEEVKQPRAHGEGESVPVAVTETAANPSSCTDAIVACSSTVSGDPRFCPYSGQHLEITYPSGNVSTGCSETPTCTCRCPKLPVVVQ